MEVGFQLEPRRSHLRAELGRVLRPLGKDNQSGWKELTGDPVFWGGGLAARVVRAATSFAGTCQFHAGRTGQD